MARADVRLSMGRYSAASNDSSAALQMDPHHPNARAIADRCAALRETSRTAGGGGGRAGGGTRSTTSGAEMTTSGAEMTTSEAEMTTSEAEMIADLVSGNPPETSRGAFNDQPMTSQ